MAALLDARMKKIGFDDSAAAKKAENWVVREMAARPNRCKIQDEQKEMQKEVQLHFGLDFTTK